MTISEKLEKNIIRKIRNYKKDGYNNYQIKLALIRHNYPSHVINHLIKKSEQHHETENHMHFTLSIISIIILIPLIGFFTYMTFKTTYDTCDNDYCFIAMANLCKPAVYEKSLEGINIIFKSDSCILTKQVISVENNLQDNPLNNKAMECKYKKNLFDKQYLELLDYSMENCKGELKVLLQSRN